MKKTTEKQQRFLDFIDNFCRENGYSPSVREIAKGLNLSSTSGVQNMIERLASKGLLNKEAGAARTVSVQRENRQLYNRHEEQGIPVIGRIRAGLPVAAEENVEGYIMFQDFLRTSSGGFFLIVEGESMKDKGINHGDYAFIRPQKEISNGQIGAFRVNGEVTLKTFCRTAEGVIELVAANNEFRPLVISEEDSFEVIGRFVMLLRLVEKGYGHMYS